MSDTISKLVAENCRKGLEQLGKMTLTLDLPPIEIEAADGKGYQVQYMEQIVSRSEERTPKGLEHIVRFFNKDKKFYRLDSVYMS